MFRFSKFCLIAGAGRDEYAISSFDSALLGAGLAHYNLVRVSSILPPDCKRSPHVDCLPGSILYTAYATSTTSKVEKIASAIAVAIPLNTNDYGVIMEYSDNADKEIVVQIAKHLAIEAMNKRSLAYKDVLAIGIEAVGDGTGFVTTFAGLALFN